MDTKEIEQLNAFLMDLESNRKIPVIVPVCRVGRDVENDVVIANDNSISRFHSVIKHQDGKYTVEDSQSRNGTFVNGNRVTTEVVPINDGDMLKLGSCTFWFVVE